MLSTDPNAKQIEEMIKAMEELSEKKPAELTTLWKEETEEQYNDMLECLPPARWKDGAFMVGECVTHTADGAIYDAHVEIDGKFYTRPALIKFFNPENYRAEIRAMFP